MIVGVIIAVVAIVIVALVLLIPKQGPQLGYQPGQCQEDWNCGGWSQCANGQQIRQCVDANNCGTTVSKPQIIQQCAQGQCQENWNCGEWSLCVNNQQTRQCIDANNCGTVASKPQTAQQCLPPIQPPGELCEPIGAECDGANCCSGYCVHGVCRNDATYCGDGECDEPENCSGCAQDCGECEGRELEQNVFTEPLSFLKEQELKEDGYTIVRYFYSEDCIYCFQPAYIENQLRELAANLRDIMVLVVIDTAEYRQEASKYASIDGTIYKPFIRVEGTADGVHGYSTLWGYSLGQKLEDGDVTVDVAPLICKHSDYCDFKLGKIERTDGTD
jgi:hypothetical protein